MFDLLIPLIPALPLAGFAFTALFGRRLDARRHWVPVGRGRRVLGDRMVVVFAALTGAGPFAAEAATG